MTTAYDWTGPIGDVWAEEWRRTDRSFADLTQQLNAAILDAAPMAGRALDIGCGAGSTSLALAAARPDIAVTGADVSPTLLAIARDRDPDRRVDFVEADVAIADLATADRGAFDLIVSRHGVMFFADPVATFRRLHAAANRGAPLVFSCFRARADNAFADELVEAVTGTRPIDPPGYAPGPFGFADAGATADMLAAASWRAITPTRIDFGYVAGEGTDPVADAVGFFQRIGPVAAAIRDASDRPAARTRLETALMRYSDGKRVTLPASAWLWQATA